MKNLENCHKDYSVDVIICSFAKNKQLEDVTLFGLKTLIDSEDSSNIYFNIIVVEGNKNISYNLDTKGHSIQTVYLDKEFGYHTYLNEGMKYFSNARWSCLCNNDLEYKKNWCSNIINIMLKNKLKNISASPCNPNENWHNNKKGDIELGYKVRKHIAGWCLFQDKSVLQKIGKLDERIRFWFSDNYYSVMLQYHKIPHLFIGNSFVLHHNGEKGTTTKNVNWDKDKENKMTYGAIEIFKKVIAEKKKQIKELTGKNIKN